MGEKFDQQPYLKSLYQTLLSTTYFGLFRNGEVTKGPHVIKAADVFVATNKRKMKFILHTSKTHNRGNKPQTVKISTTADKPNKSRQMEASKFCPYALLREYSKRQPAYYTDNDQFFVYSDGSPVTPEDFRALLKDMLIEAGYDNHDLFCIHSLRSGRCLDLLKLGLSVETIKKIGRWKSNAVFTYLKY